jgi:hypothetical protein
MICVAYTCTESLEVRYKTLRMILSCIPQVVYIPHIKSLWV